MSDVQQLAEILEILLMQKVARLPEGSAARLVYEKCMETCVKIKEGE